MIPSPLDVIVLILLVLAVGMLVVARASPRPAAGGGAEADPLPVRRDRPLAARFRCSVRLCRAEHATLVPAALATVPLTLSLDSPQPRQAAAAMPVLEAVEHRALHNGVPVDSRIERGRSPRHALRELASHERFDRIVVAAGNGHGVAGLDADDIAWLLDELPGEIVVLRPSPR